MAERIGIDRRNITRAIHKLREAGIHRCVVWDEEQVKYFFSVVDNIQVLTDSADGRKYWNKLKEILKLYGQKDGMVYDLSFVAYIGDDMLDLQCIDPVSQNGGFTACPADAVDEVKEAVDYICKQNAGEGAVRELINELMYSEAK